MAETKSPAKAKLGSNELSILCEQIALILRSGLPLHDGVEALCENYRSTRFADCFEQLNRTVLESGSLYAGIVAAGIFPKYMTEMTLIGERTGELDSVMNELSLYYQREGKIHRSIVNAVTYPLILIAMMAVLIGVLISRVLPIFEEVFAGMGVNAVSGAWMTVGMVVGRVVLIVSGVLIALALISVLVLRFERSGRFRALLFSAVKPLRTINQKIAAGRFASAMAMMLKSGYPLDESLGLISGIINSEDVSRKVTLCKEKMEQGATFPEAVEGLGIFETLHCRMIRVGFQAGQTDAVMQKLAEIYEDEVDDAITQAVSIIEPSLVALMSIIIGAILLSVMLPLLTLMGGMG